MAIDPDLALQAEAQAKAAGEQQKDSSGGLETAAHAAEAAVNAVVSDTGPSCGDALAAGEAGGALDAAAQAADAGAAVEASSGIGDALGSVGDVVGTVAEGIGSVVGGLLDGVG